ncbi:MAG: outer membrane protein assembly factor BamE, partial [Alphaproteobacteria bacterium]|nr:outer membrane protein assembly factor BamE [Alphaproteobacteria bacterium]
MHGIEPDSFIIERFQIGETTQNDVLSEFGSPLTDSTFRSDVWYYTFQRTETLAFLEPNIVYQRVYAFDFDDQG